MNVLKILLITTESPVYINKITIDINSELFPK